MPTPILLTETLLEATTGLYTFGIMFGTGETGGFLQTLTVTLYDVDTNQVVNGRLDQDILNVNDGTVTTDLGPPVVTTVTLLLQPEDTVIFNAARQVEYRVLAFAWTWDQGRLVDRHVVQFGIENVLFVP
jgi:hypothetical protein